MSDSTTGEVETGGGAQLAFDLEMVQADPEETISLDEISDPTKHELLCIGVAYRSSPEAVIESTVLLRDGLSAASEYELLQEFMDWVDAHSDAETVFTYNGKHYDYTQLHGRARRCEAAVDWDGDVVDRVVAFQEQFTHVDLMEDVEETFGHRMSLEQLAERIGIRMPTTYWRNFDLPNPIEEYFYGKTDQPWVSGEDMVVVGEELLKYREKGLHQSAPHAEMLELIWKYAESDVPVLLKLADERPFPRGRQGITNPTSGR